MRQCRGVLLTAEQTRRLTLLSGADRQRQIEMIAEHLRHDAGSHPASWGGSLRQIYAAPLGDDVGRGKHKANCQQC